MHYMCLVTCSVTGHGISSPLTTPKLRLFCELIRIIQATESTVDNGEIQVHGFLSSKDNE